MHSDGSKSFTASLLQGGMLDFSSHFLVKKATHQSSLDTYRTRFCTVAEKSSAQKKKERKEEGKEGLQTPCRLLTVVAWLHCHSCETYSGERWWANCAPCRSAGGEGDTFTEAVWSQVAVNILLMGSELCYLSLKSDSVNTLAEKYGRDTRIWRRDQNMEETPEWLHSIGNLWHKRDLVETGWRLFFGQMCIYKAFRYIPLSYTLSVQTWPFHSIMF